MAAIVAIGDASRLRALELAGVVVLPAESPVEAHRRWADLPDDVGLVLLTQSAAEALEATDAVGRGGTDRLTVVMPP